MKSRLGLLLLVVYTILPMDIEWSLIVNELSEKKQLIKKTPVNIACLSMEQMSVLDRKWSPEMMHKAKKQMSSDMKFIYDVATQLPEKIVKDIVCLMFERNEKKAEIFYEKAVEKAFLELMFNGDEKAIKEFNRLPSDQAFERYHTLKERLMNSGKSIGVMYRASEEDRYLFLRASNSDCCSLPTLRYRDKEKIDEMNGSMRQCFAGKQVYLQPNDVEEISECITCSNWSCSLPIFFTWWAQSCLFGMEYASSANVVTTYASLFGGVMCLHCSCLCCAGTYAYYNTSKVTL